MAFKTRYETARLTLRKPRLDDAGPIFSKYARDADVTRYLTWEPHGAIDDTREFLEECREKWDEGTRFSYVIETRGEAELMGMIGVEIDGHSANFGYVLAKNYWGQGYMAEALVALRDAAFKESQIYRFWAICDVDNPASARVMEKAGLEREGLLRRQILSPNVGPEPRDCLLYAVVK